ncbi:MAG TPA: hypothetical protein VGQ83_06665 [Polyangia bacterium]
MKIVVTGRADAPWPGRDGDAQPAAAPVAPGRSLSAGIQALCHGALQHEAESFDAAVGRFSAWVQALGRLRQALAPAAEPPPADDPGPMEQEQALSILLGHYKLLRRGRRCSRQYRRGDAPIGFHHGPRTGAGSLRRFERALGLSLPAPLRELLGRMSWLRLVGLDRSFDICARDLVGLNRAAWDWARQVGWDEASFAARYLFIAGDLELAWAFDLRADPAAPPIARLCRRAACAEGCVARPPSLPLVAADLVSWISAAVDEMIATPLGLLRAPEPPHAEVSCDCVRAAALRPSWSGA